MKNNSCIRKRVEAFREKTGIDVNIDIVVDAIETVFSKNIENPSDFLKMAFTEKDASVYEKAKPQFIVRKQRELSQATKDARFEKAYAKLLEKYGKEGK